MLCRKLLHYGLCMLYMFYVGMKFYFLEERRKLRMKRHSLYSWMILMVYIVCGLLLLYISLSSSFVINNVPFHCFCFLFLFCWFFFFSHIYKHYTCIIVYCFSRLFLFICFHFPFIMFSSFSPFVFYLCFHPFIILPPFFLSLYIPFTLTHLHTHTHTQTLICYNINEVWKRVRR